MSQPGADADREAAVEVHGRVVAAVWGATDRLDGTSRRAVRETLAEASLDDPDRTSWYAYDDLRAALAALLDDEGGDSLSALGRYAASVSDIDDWGSPVDGLASLDECLHAVHRGGDVGAVEFRRIGETDGRLECSMGYPCPFKRGFVTEFVDALADGVVRLNEVGTCRDDGGDRCTYELSW